MEALAVSLHQAVTDADQSSDGLIPVAQYVRMSTEHQRYSTENQAAAIAEYAKAHGMRHRAHGKMHKSVDVLKLQMELGGAIGVCCQKVSEAEVFARAGI